MWASVVEEQLPTVTFLDVSPKGGGTGPLRGRVIVCVCVREGEGGDLGRGAATQMKP